MTAFRQPELPPRAVLRYNRQATANRCAKSGKLGYRTKRKALRVAERVRKYGRARVYRCQDCRLWHLTSRS